jgi:GAF domain-containing protein
MLDPGQTSERIVTTVAHLLRVQRATLFELDRASGALVCVAVAGTEPGGSWIGQTLPPSAGVAGRAVQDVRAVSTADVLTDARAFSLPRWVAEHAEADGLRAVVAVPLVVQGEPLGALSLSDVLGRVFEDEEIRLLAAFADQAALAIASGRLHEETRRRLAETETLLAVGRAIGATLDLTEAMRRVAREFGRVIEADMVGAYAPTEDGRALHAMAGYHVPPDRLDVFRQLRVPLVDHPFLAEARATRRPVWSSDVPTDPRIDREIVARLPHRSLLFVPMFAKDALLGGLFAAWWTQARTFGADELRLAEGIGRQAALALENARTSSW